MIAFVGHSFAHKVHPTQISGFIQKSNSSVHFPVGQNLSITWDSYSSLNSLIVERTGEGADLPSPHKDESITALLSSSRVVIVSRVPLPSIISSSRPRICFVPSRQGVHLPQDSSWVNCMKNRAIWTMQASLFITTIPPEPTIDPIFLRESKESGISRCFSGRHPPDGPPV